MIYLVQLKSSQWHWQAFVVTSNTQIDEDVAKNRFSALKSAHIAISKGDRRDQKSE